MRKFLIILFITLLAPQVTNSQVKPDSLPIPQMIPDQAEPDTFPIRQTINNRLKTDSSMQTIRAWKLTDDFSKQQNYPVDTIFFQTQIFNPNFQIFPFNAYLGNLGSPALANDYLQRINQSDLPFLYPYKYYIHLPQNQIYYNVRKPFTDLDYTTGTGKQKNEQTLRVLHTQNVNENLNAGIDFDLISSDGRYSNQKTGLKSLSFFASYVLEKYNIHASFNRNVISVNENGGIINDQDLNDTKSEDVPVNLGNLNNAQSELKNINFLLVQSYTVGKKRETENIPEHEPKRKLNLLGTVTYTFQYMKNHRRYFDDFPEAGFYNNILLDSISTADSVYYRTIQNNLHFSFQNDPSRKFQFGGRIGIQSEIEKFSTIIPTDTVVKPYSPDIYTQPEIKVWINNNDTTFKQVKDVPNTNLALTGHLFNALGTKFNWEAWGKLYLSGYKVGDFVLEGAFNKSFSGTKGISELTLYGKLQNYRPGYWYNNYYSNHFTWKNNLNNVTETTITAIYNHPARKLKARASYSLMDQYVYFDTLASPTQSPEILSVFALSLEKDFILGRWNFLNHLIFQRSDHNEIFPLPALLLKQTTYFQHNFHFDLTNGDLLTQWGFDLFYHTPYFGYAYMPAIGQFFLQREKKIGNYPFLDVFINVKLKRTRFFLKYEHVTSGLLGENYFTVLHYPMNQRVFKFGLSWTFYD